MFMALWLFALQCLSTQWSLVQQPSILAVSKSALSVVDLLHRSNNGGGHHGTPRGRRKQVTWLHLHKFGGTFITKMARLQGEVFPVGNINANWMPDFCSTPRGERILCIERTGFGTPASGISWSAIERELDSGDFCDDMLVGVMLREPLGALQSVLSHDRFDKGSILNTLKACSEAVPAKHFMYQPPALIPNAPLCLPAWDTYHHFDNFATRTLGGAYLEPPCGITRSHLEAAKTQLQRMDVVTILEELSAHLDQFRNTFRWNLTLVQPWRKVNRKAKHGQERSQAFTSAEMGFLTKFNALDIELYDFGRSLARNMTQKAQANSAAIGDDQLQSRTVQDVSAAVDDDRPQSQKAPRAREGMDALRQRVAHRLSLRRRPFSDRVGSKANES